MSYKSVGIRELKQNASAVVAKVRAGDSLVVTDRGVPVARLVPLGDLGLDELVATGQATPPSMAIDEILQGIPTKVSGAPLSTILHELRDDNRL
jgi:prevent-host-death family protein